MDPTGAVAPFGVVGPIGLETADRPTYLIIEKAISSLIQKMMVKRLMPKGALILLHF